MKSNTKNAVFLQRLVAYLIDAIIITIVISLIAAPFINSDAIQKINSDLLELVNQLQNNELSYLTYVKEVSVLELQLAKLNGVTTIVTLFVSILYFVVFQIYNGGQTIGKQILKIKVISNNGDLTMNQMIVRSLLINTILLNMILLIAITFISDPMQYLYVFGSFESIQYLFVIVTVLMVMFRKNHVSLHDLITNTRVVKK